MVGQPFMSRVPIQLQLKTLKSFENVLFTNAACINYIYKYSSILLKKTFRNLECCIDIHISCMLYKHSQLQLVEKSFTAAASWINVHNSHLQNSMFKTISQLQHAWSTLPTAALNLHSQLQHDRKLFTIPACLIIIH